MMHYDVIIIGAGVVGSAVAHALCQYEGKVALLEKKADVAEGASKANSGIVHAGFDAKPDTLKAKYNIRGKEMYKEYCAKVGAPYGQPGALVIGFTQEDQKILEHLYTQGQENGAEGLRIVTAEEAIEMEPNVNPNIIGALYAPTSGITSPYELTFALADTAALNGVDFFLDTQVLHMSFVEERWKIETTNGVYFSRAIVNCAGMGAMAIHNLISDDPCELIPRRGEYYLLDRDDEMPFYMTMFQCPTPMGKGVLITPTVHGNTLLGPTAKDITDPEDVATTTDGLEEILKKVQYTWPQYSMRSTITTFSGIRAHSTKDDFVVGAVSGAPMAFEALGIESPGLTAAPAIAEDLCGQIVAELSLNKKEEEIKKRENHKPFYAMNDVERAQAVAENAQWGNIVCRCEMVTEAEIRISASRPVPATNIDGVKRRTRAGMGRCQGGFCSPRVMEILAEEMNVPFTKITKNGGESYVLVETIAQAAKEARDNEC
ncbi:MAG: NAD(P)/FAD-dependent oxidoreductase [Clostridiales bacterium]|nr:NAD(P)/FAD-dependent oxidoreductase [Clostridiales bacterium]